jgi:hypothetical protein
LTVVGLALACLVVAALAWRTTSSLRVLDGWDQPLPFSADASPPAVEQVADSRVGEDRPTYPFSVIPGGAHTPDALRDAVARDPVVAAHYDGFDVEAARVTRLDAPRAAYVSYRMGQNVFWTRRKITVPAGEPLLTDGRRLARTRCGNQIADDPGVTAPDEPSPALLDTPLPNSAGTTSPFSLARAYDLSGLPSLAPGVAGVVPVASDPIMAGGAVAVPIPFPFAIPPGSSGGTGPGEPPVCPPENPTTPPVPPTEPPPVPPTNPPPPEPPTNPPPPEPPTDPPPPGPPTEPPPPEPPTEPPPPWEPPEPPVPVPEPTTLLLLAPGLAASYLLRKRRDRRH